MKKSDLKNGMSFECRGGAKYFIINGKIYRDKGTLIPTGVFEERMRGYSNNLLALHSDGKMDIMKIYNIDDKLIWEREEIDWSKIPKDKVTAEELQNSYDDMCAEYHGCCSYCSYKTSRENCEFSWLLDNYNVSPK